MIPVSGLIAVETVLMLAALSVKTLVLSVSEKLDAFLIRQNVIFVDDLAAKISEVSSFRVSERMSHWVVHFDVHSNLRQWRKHCLRSMLLRQVRCAIIPSSPGRSHSSKFLSLIINSTVLNYVC